VPLADVRRYASQDFVNGEDANGQEWERRAENAWDTAADRLQRAILVGRDEFVLFPLSRDIEALEREAAGWVEMHGRFPQHPYHDQKRQAWEQNATEKTQKLRDELVERAESLENERELSEYMAACKRLQENNYF